MKPIGLRALDEYNEELLVGRERETESILQILQKNKLVTISGPSGSGKTSLLNTGLIPRLKKGFLGQAGKDWSICYMRPGIDPIGNLSHAIAWGGNMSNNEKSNPNDPKNFKEIILGNDPLGIINIVKDSSNFNQKNFLIIVDNIEDVFKFTEGKEEQINEEELLFFNTIARTIKEKEIALYFVFAVDSTYLSNLSRFNKLQDVLNSSLHTLQNLSNQSLIALTDKMGIKLDNNIGDYLWEETYSNVCYLPNFVLATEILAWKIKSGELGDKPITIEDYKKIGGIRGVISSRCESYYNSLNEERKMLIQKLFKSIYNYDQENAEVYYPSTENLCSIINETIETVSDIIFEIKNILGDSIEIIPKQISGIKPNKQKHISLDSHISFKYNECRNWFRETTWAKEELISFEQYKEFSESSTRYLDGKSSLLISPELENALSWLNNPIHNKNWAKKYSYSFSGVVDYIKKSEADFNLKKQIENERLNRKRRNTKIIISVVSSLMVIAIVTSFWGYKEQKIAKEAEKDALTAKEKAEQSRQDAINAEKLAVEEMNKAFEAESKAAEEEQKAKIAFNRAEKNRIYAEIAKLEAVKQRDKSDSLSLIALNKEKQARESEERALNLKMIADLKTEFYPLLLELQRNEKLNGNKELTQESPVIKNILTVLKKYKEYENLINEYKKINRVTSFIDSETDGLNMLLRNSLEILTTNASNKSSQSPMNIFSNPSGGAIRSLALYGNDLMALGGDDQTISIFNVRDNFKKIKIDIKVGERIRDLIFVSENQIICSTFKGSIYSYSLDNPELKKTLYRSNSPVNNLFLNQKNQKIIGLSETEIIEINLSNNKFQNTILEVQNPTAALQNNNTIYFSSGKSLYSFKNGKIELIKVLGNNQKTYDQYSSLLIQTSQNSLNSNSSSYLLAGTKSGQIIVYKMINSLSNLELKHLGEFTIHSSEITKLYYDSEFKKTYSASFDNQVKKYALNFDNISESARTNISLNGHEKWVWDIAKVQAPNNKPIIITADENGNAMYWYTNPSDLYESIKNMLGVRLGKS